MGKMEYMKGYSNGYTPPNGSAGGEAFGNYSTKKNPRPVPKKGSQLSERDSYGMNADRSKAMRLMKEQATKENLRGQAC